MFIDNISRLVCDSVSFTIYLSQFISKNIVGELMNPHDLPQQRQLADGLTIMGLEKDMVGGAVEVSYMYSSISIGNV